jgi:VIT1/CCC1 family predicted Fe2+/Mn2+ transporter
MSNSQLIHEKASIFGDAVLASSDGLITTFAVVSGSTGGSLDNRVILILGFANLLADGFSMASGIYLAKKSELEYEAVQGEKDITSPIRHGLITFIAFNLGGLLSLFPFIFHIEAKFATSAFVAGMGLLLIGILRSRYTKKNWLQSAFETFSIGGFAAFAAYAAGFILDKYLGK